jgi:hypothetical protein
MALVLIAIVGAAIAFGTGAGRRSTPAHPTSGQLYWRDPTGIGRANLDGTGVVRQLIPFNGTENIAACGVVLDRNYVYWAVNTALGPNTGPGALARAKRDGTGVDTSFIAAVPGGVYCVAVDGAHIYWAGGGGLAPVVQPPLPLSTIGRANLDGTGVESSFILGVDKSCGIAVDRAHIYWASSATGTIGRANLDGTGVNRDFISGLDRSAPGTVVPVCGIVVDGTHIYWGNRDGTIGRANLDGTAVNKTFITEPAIFGGYPLVCGHDSTYLYFASAGLPQLSRSWIGRARLDGTDVQADFTTGVGYPFGCAVGP